MAWSLTGMRRISPLFQPDKGLRRLRFSRKPCRQFRTTCLRLFLAEETLSDVFAAAILNSQPMIHAPAQLVRDAREHGVEIRPADVNFSDWDNTLEADGNGYRSLRLGFRQIKGFPENDAIALTDARDRPYRDPADIQKRARLSDAALERLAKADA